MIVSYPRYKTLEHKTHTIALNVKRYDDMNIAFHEFYLKKSEFLCQFSLRIN